MLLYWLPLGAGGSFVRWNGRVFEAIASRRERRARGDLYHSALEVCLGSDHCVIEMAPAWSSKHVERGVVRSGPVGSAWLGQSVLFRYEIRCWRNGVIPDAEEAVASPQVVSQDDVRARRLLTTVAEAPALTWGRDELGAGEMWNSNSLVAWLLARSDHHMDTIRPPANGRAPGWKAGLTLASRQQGNRAESPENTCPLAVL